MCKRRIQCQLELALMYPDAIVGCNFYRLPAGSTARYCRWANGLSREQLATHRFRDCTIIQPTWFMARTLFERQDGGYDTKPAEDLVFQLRHWDEHVRSGAAVAGHPAFVKCEESLLMYRWRPGQLTLSVPRARLREVRVRALERQVLRTQPWSKGFAIWGGGKDGRAFYRELQPEFQRLVSAFHDVDKSKVCCGISREMLRCSLLPISGMVDERVVSITVPTSHHCITHLCRLEAPIMIMAPTEGSSSVKYLFARRTRSNHRLSAV